MTVEEMQFFENLFRSLETEMNSRFDAVDSRFDAVTARLDQLNARMERIGGLVNGGGRALAKINTWAESNDVLMADLLRRQQDLEQRLRKLEGK